jgi:outer membrane murein-binding lipoprotein Lpp
MQLEAAEDEAMKRYLCAAAVVAGVVLLAGCAPDRYAYAPVTTSSADLEGASAAVYGVPPDAPRGEVRVAMLGVASAPALGGAQETRSRAIHVALAVSNRADEPWTIDPSEQRLIFTAKRERSDVYAMTSDASRAGPVLVPARATRVIDLYFALPIQLEKESAPPPFELRWTVHAGSQSITQRTPFQRFLVAPTPSEDRDLRRPTDMNDDDLPRRTLPGVEPPERLPLLPFGEPPVE